MPKMRFSQKKLFNYSNKNSSMLLNTPKPSIVEKHNILNWHDCNISLLRGLKECNKSNKFKIYEIGNKN